MSSSAKNLIYLVIAMVAWVLVFSLVIRPYFFPEPEKPEPANEETSPAKEDGEEQKKSEPDSQKSEDSDTAADGDTTESGSQDTETGEETSTDSGESDSSETAAQPTTQSKAFSFDGLDNQFIYNADKSEPGRKLVYEYQVPDSAVTVSKIFEINDPENLAEDAKPTEREPYISNVTIRFENKGPEDFSSKGYLISTGAVSLLNPQSNTSDFFMAYEGASVTRIKGGGKLITESRPATGIKWASVANKYFCAVIQPVSEDLQKSISRVVVDSFQPDEVEDVGPDGTLDTSVPYLKNGYLDLMFSPERASADNVILEANSVVHGRYDKNDKLQRHENLPFMAYIPPDIHRAFALRANYVEESEEKTKATKLCYALALGVEEVRVPAGETVEHKYNLYVGPKQYHRLKDIGFTNAINFSRWLRAINILFLNILHWFYSVIPNYGVAILLLTLLIKIILFPLDQKSYKSMKEMQKIQPLIAELKEKYKDDPKKAQVKQMELFREHKVNPLGGCLPLLLQFPVLIAMFYTLKVAFELRGAKFILWITDLSQPDSLFDLPGGGFWMVKSLNILPLLMIAAFYFQQKMSSTVPKDPNDPQYKQQQMMAKIFPIVFGFIFYNMPSGLTLYFTFSTLLRVLQQLWVIKQPDETPQTAMNQPARKG